MFRLVNFALLCFVKVISHIFFRFELAWMGEKHDDPYKSDVRLIMLLNHTSLYEPLFLGLIPFSFLLKFAMKGVSPGADKTLNRPIVGIFWKLVFPQIVAISRRRDKTWTKFMDKVSNKAIVCMAPEGRMKRPTGFDLHGKPMSVRGGFVDVLNLLDEGKMMIAYSGGLHHIQVPGQSFPNLFKTIKMNVEVLDIANYKNSFESADSPRKAMIADLQARLESNCPEEQPY